MDQILVEAPGYLSLRLVYTCTKATLNKDDMKASIIISVIGCMGLTYLCIVSSRVVYVLCNVELLRAKIEDSHVAVLSNVAPRHRLSLSPSHSPSVYSQSTSTSLYTPHTRAYIRYITQEYISISTLFTFLSPGITINESRSPLLIQR